MRLLHLLVSLLALLSGVSAFSRSFPASAAPPDYVTTVHVLSSNHLDVGFNTVGTQPNTYLAADVIDEYNRVYFQRALNSAQALRDMAANGTNPHNVSLTWTTHPWLVSMYFDCPPAMGFYCPTQQEKEAVQAGIQRRDITWHAFPFNSELELYTPDLLEFGVQLARDLAVRLKRPGPLPNTVSQRDVPGTTRSIIPHLRATGVQAMSIGVNFGSAPVVLPSISLWRDPPSNTSLYLLYHGRGYGGIATINDFAQAEGFAHALALDWRGDNSGPPAPAELIANFNAIQALWPGRQVRMSTFEEFINLLDAAVTGGADREGSAQYRHAERRVDKAAPSIKLPEFTNEMGDTWIHGAGTDPLKVAQWRAVLRLRSACVRDPYCNSTTPAFHNFSRLLLKGGEHTWGSDVKQLLRYSSATESYEYYSWNNLNLSHLSATNADYRTLVYSWQEQRAWAVHIPLSALPPSHPIRADAAREFRALMPPPRGSYLTGFTPYPLQNSRTPRAFPVGGLNLSFSPVTGALTSLLHVASGHDWAGPDRALGEVIYQTFDEAHSYDTFLSDYISFDMDTPGSDQYPRYDFGKRGLDASASPQPQLIHPRVRNDSLWVRKPGVLGYDASFLVELEYDAELREKYGAPEVSALLLSVNASALTLHYTLVHYNKTRTRIPEAGWLAFHPRNEGNGTLEVWKVGQWVDLAQGVMGNGSAHLHYAGERGVRLAGEMEGSSPDVGLMCVGYPPTPFPTPLATIVGDKGAFAFNTINNIWGTNYPMWYPFQAVDSSQQYRVEIRLQRPQEKEG